MKRIIIVVLMLFLMFSVAIAEPEISFNNIPWLSDEKNTVQSLIEKGFVTDDSGIMILRDDLANYLIIDDTDIVLPDRISGADEVTFSASLSGKVKGKIAGYPIKDMKLIFAYDGEYRLIAINIELINGSYDDLKAKLLRVYGEAETKETEEGIWSNVWQNAEKSAVVLYTQSEGIDYILMYGRVDAEEILLNCLAPADPDDISGL